MAYKASICYYVQKMALCRNTWFLLLANFSKQALKYTKSCSAEEYCSVLLLLNLYLISILVLFGHGSNVHEQ
jgi:hypothetical protein